MSVLVKGMMMPEDCSDCDFLSGLIMPDEIYTCDVPTDVCGKNCTQFVEEGGRPDWCPLVEVPVPHGNLIDTSQSVECMFWDSDKEKWVLKSAALSEVLSMTVYSEPVKIVIPKEDAEHDEHSCTDDYCPIEGVE